MEEEVRLYSPGGAPRIVAIGGGHGLSTMLRGLKKYSRDISAIVTTADDGGGSGMLRQDLGDASAGGCPGLRDGSGQYGAGDGAAYELPLF